MSEALAVKRGAWFNLGNDFHVSYSSFEIRSLQNLNLLFFRLNTETVEADALDFSEESPGKSFLSFSLCVHTDLSKYLNFLWRGTLLWQTMSESDGNVQWVKLNLASLTSIVVLQVGYTAVTPGGCTIQVVSFLFLIRRSLVRNPVSHGKSRAEALIKLIELYQKKSQRP